MIGIIFGLLLVGGALSTVLLGLMTVLELCVASKNRDTPKAVRLLKITFFVGTGTIILFFIMMLVVAAKVQGGVGG